MTTTQTHLNQALKHHTIPHIAQTLGLHPNTIQRWIQQQNTPPHYHTDLQRLLHQKPHTTHQTPRQKNQYYTKPKTAQHCWQTLHKTAKKLQINLTQYHYIEPAAGNGAFYNLLPPNRRTGIDIEPTKNPNIQQTDYLKWTPPKPGKYTLIGNPPFGLRGHLALQFINHSQPFADLIAFILPPLFNSDGKGVPAKRVQKYTNAHTENLPPDSFIYPDGTNVQITAIFQIWTKINTHLIPPPHPKTCKKYIKVYSLSDGGTPSSTRNKNMLYKCHLYMPSTCFTGMKLYFDFESLPHRRGYGVVIHKEKQKILSIFKNTNLPQIAFRSTNGALNLRTSLIEQILINEGIYDD